MKKKGLKILLILFVIILILANYFTFIYTPRCSDISCFEAKLTKCRRASYIKDAEEMAWYYKIKGDSGNKCIVLVKALQAKKGIKEVERLEGKQMTCELPLGIVTPPEADPNLCTGRLKEEMQAMIIEKLHQYILQQIGEISAELIKPLD